MDQILAADDTTIERVPVPEWSGAVYVRTISGDKRDEIDSAYAGAENLIGIRARVVGTCLCNAEGEFCNPTDSQILALGRKSSAALDRVFEACQRINGMRDRDVKELEGNSEMVAGQDSG